MVAGVNTLWECLPNRHGFARCLWLCAGFRGRILPGSAAGYPSGTSLILFMLKHNLPPWQARSARDGRIRQWGRCARAVSLDRRRCVAGRIAR